MTFSLKIIECQNFDRINLTMTMSCKGPPHIVGNFCNKVIIKMTANSYIYSGINKQTGEKVILKYIPIQEQDNQADTEFAIQNSIRYKYIMPIEEAFDFEDRLHVLVMKCAIGSLDLGFLENYFKSSLQVYKIMYQITEGLSFLHSAKILHGKISPSDIVLINNDEYMPFPCIIDFGHAQVLEQDKDAKYYSSKYCTDTHFAAPEVLIRSPHSFPSDIFSLGATFYFLITGDHILNQTLPGLRVNLIKDLRELPYTNKFGPEFPQSGKELIQSMLNADPLSRPTADQILQSKFFSENVLNDRTWVNDEENFKRT